MRKFGVVLTVLFIAMLFTSCTSAKSLSYVYDAQANKYVRLDRSDTYIAKNDQKSHTIYFSSNRSEGHRLLARSRDTHTDYSVYPASAASYTQILNLCPNGHPLDVTGFNVGDRVRCPDDNMIFPVGPDYRTHHKNPQFYYL